ncbi:MAG: ABC transporter permease subunit [Verrucomicrobia bacterium]|nr:ABC transporter permease subunit [Verrucomicrobiota bacterium]
MEYLILSLCITLSSVVLAGSLSLYFSINSKKAYEAVFRTLFVLAVIYIFIPIYLVACSLIYDMIESNSGHIRIHEILITISIAIAPILIVGIYGIIYYIRNYEKYTSPLLSIGGILFLTVLVIISHVAILYMFIIDETGIIFMIGVYYNPLILMIMIIDPFSIASGNIASYYTVLINCAISLALSGILMSISIAKVRKRALENILKTNAVRKNDYDDKIELNKHTNEKIRRVDKDPVVWKESCTPMIEGGNRTRKIIISFVVAALLFVYSLGMSTKTMVYNTSHITIITMYVCLGILWCAVVSAISLTTEKEKQCMPLLLTTLITDMNIIKGKIIGCLRRSIVIWSLLYAHLIIFIYGGIIHIIALPLMSIVIIWTLAFTISLGIYLSTIYKKSTTAIMSCIFIIAVLWLAPRIATQYARNIDHRNYIVAICKIMNPIDQTIQIMGKTSGKNNVEKDINNILNDPPKNGIHTFKTTIYIILLISVIYMIVSVLQTWKAMNNIRKKIE